jgi:hypothetical protein
MTLPLSSCRPAGASGVLTSPGFLSEEGVDEKDHSFKVSYEAKFDGKEYPITGDPDSDSVSLQRVNEREIKFTTKKAGKVVSKLDVIVSKDRQITTVNYTDYSQGKTDKGSAVYDKQ